MPGCCVLTGAAMAKPELLAPAGNWDALTAAVQNGADAVYLGARSFNARQSADNFDSEGLVRAIDYAHVRGVNVYAVVNVLIADTELEDAVRLLEFLYRAGVDGVIVQDLGLARLARELVPGLTLHASTQMTVHNPEGARYLRDLGFTRVVPARELSLAEIRLLKSAGGLEVETFIHGALCFCYSGQCLMSSLIGGRSGNRGRCAQPCRLPYTLTDERGRPVETDVAGNYILSPRDLNLSAHLPDLIAAGVDAFKIEGRLRRAEYVAVVVSVYRKLLDRALEGDFYVSADEQRMLAQAFNRGFTTGYLFGRPGRELMNYMRANNRGIPIGRVKSYRPADRRVSVALDGPLAEGDIVDFWVKVGGRVAATVSGLEVEGKRVAAADRGQVVSFPVNGRVRAGDRVFKVLDAEMTRRARETFTSPRERKQIALAFTMHLREGQPVRLEVRDADGRTAAATGTVPAEIARKRPLTPETAAAQLSRLGNTPFVMGELDCDIERELMVPLGELNTVRREALARLEEERARGRKPSFESVREAEQRVSSWIERRRKSPVIRPVPVKKPLLGVTAGDLDGVRAAADAGADVVYFPGDALGCPRMPKPEEIIEAAAACRARGAELYFWFPRIVREGELTVWEGLYEDVSDAVTGVMVSNLGGLERFAGRGLRVVTDFPLNIFNSEALRVMAASGVGRVTLSPEMTMAQIQGLSDAGVELEALVQGPVPMMVSEHCVPGSLLAKNNGRACGGACRGRRFYLRDRKGELFPLGLDTACRMHVFNPKDLCVVDHLPVLLESGVACVRVEGRVRDAAYIRRVTAVYREVLDRMRRGDDPLLGDARETLIGLSPSGITTGHYYRGVL